MGDVCPIVFRLYPEKGSRFVRVNVWPTKRAMQAHQRSQQYRPMGGEASCTQLDITLYQKGKSARRRPIVAEVNFHRRSIGTEVITHELFHATMAFGRRLGFKWERLGVDYVNKDEEKLTYIHGRLCRDFVDRAYDAGLYAR